MLAEEVPPQEVPVLAVEAEPESIEDALCVVLQKAKASNGLVCGLSEVTRALDRRTAHLCLLAEDCEDEQYKTLVTALAKSNDIDLITVEERAKLAQWAGLVRTSPSGEATKTFKCSCVAVRDFGERSKALEYLLAQLH